MTFGAKLIRHSDSLSWIPEHHGRKPSGLPGKDNIEELRDPAGDLTWEGGFPDVLAPTNFQLNSLVMTPPRPAEGPPVHPHRSENR